MHTKIQLQADLEKTGILGSWILRNICENHQIEEQLEQCPMKMDFNAGKLNLRIKIILKCSLFAIFNTFLLIMIYVLMKFCKLEEH